jgi:hypothetical protein
MMENPNEKNDTKKTDNDTYRNYEKDITNRAYKVAKRDGVEREVTPKGGEKFD